MILATNNARAFFEETTSGIYIYGAGDYGRWVARFMQKCNMEFEGFIDRGKLAGGECYALGKPVIHPDALQSLSRTRLRIIITVHAANEVLADLAWRTGRMDVLCMVPIYNDVALGECRYDINKFLSYFRSKLIRVEVPTIFSNRCTAGYIYKALGVNMISPTINTGISPENFLKICKNPKDYFSENMVFDHWTITQFRSAAVGRVKDVEVLFAHAEDGLQAIRRWNKMRKWINWNYLVYVMSDTVTSTIMPTFSCQMAEKFCSMKDKHMLITRNALYAGKNLQGCMFVNHEHFHDKDRVIESWFDLIGWINGEYEI